MLTEIELPSSIDQIPIPDEISDYLAASRQRIEAFQDRWDESFIEQFVAADYTMVYQTLTWILEYQPLIGKRFLEWGCGFAITSSLASALGLAVFGIEAHEDLIPQARKTLEQCEHPFQIVHGDFLPRGTERLADDPTLPSLGHAVPCGYEAMGLELDDFALVYSYPWPQEDLFHELVFDQRGARGALMLMFIGPNEMRLMRKTS
ncbi:class I SAM-dependent methyltransferase [Stieleria varia]|uniref:Mg-protoporphyrin IX methyl transferase n=1 Tax=Stieleria varia TaxID=2528005 RepID=A0A5C6AZF1_9BACT|nr:class I SAM-dependent methyltransferase [Stieleria varia]TWU04877.1 hypothetical protein Pla52n_29220 [Stieleria varia]